MKSIALKLWFGMMTLVSIVLVLLWLFQIVFLGKFYKDIRISNVKKEGLEIIKEIESDNFAEFERKAEEFSYNNSAVVELIDLDYKTLYSTDTMGMHGHMGMGMGMMKGNSKIHACGEAFDGKTTQTPMSHPRFGSESILTGLPVTINDNVVGALLIELPMMPVEDTINILKQQLFYIIITLLIASLLLSFFLSRGFTNPILDIITVSEKIAEGDLGARVSLNRRDEIGELANTINYMGSELTKIDQLRKDLIANVSHELRTPLSIIKGYAETIKDISGNNPDKRDKHIDIIIEESDRLSYIVDDILNFSQIQAGYLPINKTTFMINHMLNDIAKRYEIKGDQLGVTINLTVSGDIPVLADEAKIEQVIHNLISNALNHSSKEGVITVLALQNNNITRIEISDTGSGIPDDEIKYIWDRFYKADKSGERNTAGTGLGLAIVKNILVAHGFEHGVTSQLGTGTTFWFELENDK